MNINTKQITAIAVLSLFAYTANALNGDLNTGPASLVIQPVPAAGAGVMTYSFSVPDGVLVEGVGETPNLKTFTTTSFVGSATAQNETYTVGNGGNAVSIQNDGINLATVTAQTDTTTVDIYSETVATLDLDNLTAGLTEVYTSYAVVAGTGVDGTRIVLNNNGDTEITDDDTNPAASEGTVRSEVIGIIELLSADDASLAGAVTAGTPGDPTGGTLNVGGNLSVGAIGDVESSITDNTTAITANAQAVTDLANGAVATNAQNVTDLATGAVAANTQAVTDNTTAVAANAQAVTDLATGAVAGNTGAITTLNGGVDVDGSVANSIAAANAASGISGNGITGVVEKQTNDAGDDIVKLGANSFFFNSTTDTISSTSGDITLAADVAITGDLEVAGDIFVGGRSQGVQSQIDNNREDIDRNARGIAMVAALQHTTVLPGMSNALDVSAAHFEGETGLALNYARRISDNVQINFGAASTSDFDESVIKAGVGVQW